MKERRVGAVASLPWGRALDGGVLSFSSFLSRRKKRTVSLFLSTERKKSLAIPAKLFPLKPNELLSFFMLNLKSV